MSDECPVCLEEVDYTERHYDARGIYIKRCCEECWLGVQKQYRPDVLTDCNYECDEPIEAD